MGIKAIRSISFIKNAEEKLRIICEYKLKVEGERAL